MATTTTATTEYEKPKQLFCCTQSTGNGAGDAWTRNWNYVGHVRNFARKTHKARGGRQDKRAAGEEAGGAGLAKQQANCGKQAWMLHAVVIVAVDVCSCRSTWATFLGWLRAASRETRQSKGAGGSGSCCSILMQRTVGMKYCWQVKMLHTNKQSVGRTDAERHARVNDIEKGQNFPAYSKHSTIALSPRSITLSHTHTLQL